MSELVALVAFSVVSSVTPGPNNVLLWASGVQFGFRPTVPHVIGTSVGIGAMAVAVAAGLGTFVTAVPEVDLGLKVVGSIYLLYLAYQIAASAAVQRSEVARPLRLGQAAAFQCVNPKAWIFALAAVSAFRPAGLSVATGSAAVVLIMMLVVLLTAAVWAGAGSVVNRFVSSPRAYNAISVGMAVVLASSVVYLWV